MKDYTLIFDKYKAGKTLRLILERLPEKVSQNLLSKIAKNFSRLDGDLRKLHLITETTGPKYLDYASLYYQEQIFSALLVQADKHAVFSRSVLDDIMTYSINVICAKVKEYKKKHTRFVKR